MQHQLLKEQLKLKGEVKWIKTKDGILIAESPWMKNQILAGDELGAYLILDRLAGVNDYSLNITHAEIGDDNTPAEATDTGLINAIERTSISAVSRSGLTATFRFFFPDATTDDDTYEEFGMIVDGTASIGTGKAFNRLVMSTPLVKATGEDNTIVCKVTVTV